VCVRFRRPGAKSGWEPCLPVNLVSHVAGVNIGFAPPVCLVWPRVLIRPVHRNRAVRTQLSRRSARLGESACRHAANTDTQAQTHTGTDTHRHVHLVCALDTWDFWMSGSGATQRQRATYTHMRALDGAGHGRWQHTRTHTHTICAPGSEGYSPRTLFTRNLVSHASGVYSGTCRGPPSLGGRLKRHQPNTHTHTRSGTHRETQTQTHPRSADTRSHLHNSTILSAITHPRQTARGGEKATTTDVTHGGH
jgi:hypothetical protein